MLNFFYGQDTYRSREEIRKIIDEYKKANPDWLDFVRIDANNKEIEIFQEIRQSIDTVSMFNQKKLVIIENIFLANQETQKAILDFLKKKNIEKDKDIMTIFCSEEISEKNELFRFLKSKADCRKFELLKGHQLKNWVKNFVLGQKGKIENSAIEKLLEYVGSDLWRMSNEINKLLNYSRAIRVKDVELLIKPEIDLNIFEMVDALGYKNKNKVLKIFRQYLEKREDEGYLLAMFIYQIRNLIKVKSRFERGSPEAAGGKLDMHPFVIRKSRQQVRNFNWEELKKIYHQLLTIDFDIKTGRVDPKTGLELFVACLP
jgi:DNA polymerase-3 subunit delta